MVCRSIYRTTYWYDTKWFMTKPHFHIKFVNWDSVNTNPDLPQPYKYGLYLFYPGQDDHDKEYWYVNDQKRWEGLNEIIEKLPHLV